MSSSSSRPVSNIWPVMKIAETFSLGCAEDVRPATRQRAGDGGSTALSALTGHVASDADALGLFGELVHLVDVHDAALRGLHILAALLEQLEQRALHVLHGRRASHQVAVES